MRAPSEFRTCYRDTRIGRYYSGRAHFGFLVAFCVAGIALCLSQLDRPGPWEWLTIPLTFLYANLVEYLGHRFVMHRRCPGLGAVFERHACQHHRFFTDRTMALEGWQDMKAVLFPAVLMVFFFGGFAAPTGLLVAWLFGANVAWLFVATALAYYLNYELFHLAYHLPEQSLVMKIPGFARLRRLHHDHHDPEVMTHANFNITWPICDRFFGTRRYY